MNVPRRLDPLLLEICPAAHRERSPGTIDRRQLAIGLLTAALSACQATPASTSPGSIAGASPGLVATLDAATVAPTPTRVPVTFRPTPQVIGSLFRDPVEIRIEGDPATVAVEDMNADGNVDIVTANFDGSVSLFLGSGGGEFGRAPDLAGGDGPATIAIADLNADKRPDIALTHTGRSDAGTGADDLVIFLAKGDGTFRRLDRAAGSSPQGLVIADFDRDGKPDIATANNADHVSIFNGHGDGTFSDPASAPIGQTFSSGIAAADLNRDGIVDLVTANSLVGMARSTRTVSVLLGRADGAFATPVVYDVGGAQPIIPVLADLNGDGAPDIGTPNGYPAREVSVLLNHGDGTFASSVEYPSGPNPHTLLATDLDADDRPDLVAGDLGEEGGPVGQGISILFGVGDGTLEPNVDFGPELLGEQIAAAGDLDGDGKADLIVISDHSIKLLFNAIVRA